MNIKLSLFLFSAMFFFSFSKKPKPARVIFFGDSITEAAVNPGGYIVRMREMIGKQQRTDAPELIGSGIGGNKVYDLFLRLEKDVLEKKPDHVFIYIGVNDVWHKRTHGTGTDPWKFVQFYEALIQKLQAQGTKLTLVTPACIGEKSDCTNELDGDLNLYSQMIRDLAAKFNCGLCDLRQVFMDYNVKNNPKNTPSGILTTDGVHLNEAGNQLVAEQMLRFL